MKNATIMAALLVSLAISGCVHPDGTSGATAAAPPQPSTDALTIALGPCFGFRPVYEITLGPDGDVTLDGQRHTATLDIRHRQVDAATRRTIAEMLAPQPSAGRSNGADRVRRRRNRYISSTITWTDQADTRTTATHQAGCPGGKGHELDAVLRDLPERLGIEEWSKQKTRPGTSRG